MHGTVLQRKNGVKIYHTFVKVPYLEGVNIPEILSRL